ncbi:MAG TPA: PIG-L family deacetylase [Anaerolineae bacterium]|nr:PIG-L family deacetylase [Anaerolineae bacterium]
MQFSKPTADIYVPDGENIEEALRRTTHLAIGAHPDDIEAWAYDGIRQCFDKESQWFTAVTVTNGSGAPRDYLYAEMSDEKMMQIRRLEQRKAAHIGNYSAAIQLDYFSHEVKEKKNHQLITDIESILKMTKPKIAYTHNLADKHDTHLAVALRVIEAMRKLPQSEQPEKVYGFEAWRDLDWMVDKDKVIFDISGHPNLASALIAVYDTQNIGSKRYDLGIIARRTAHAIMSETHGTGSVEGVIFAMDLTPLIKDLALDPCKYALEFIQHLSNDVKKRIKKLQ